ncbi:MAG: sulfatase-like hydrolase/transferase, partial [Gammaproteobacteria bacterium]|nr:sulfatase-like hydrolase/transferase [Gammaproteobacteria bacterium]MBT7531383.1 sulfatase-like hydrolase/transferase [Gammaproteobacteria bacterium]
MSKESRFSTVPVNQFIMVIAITILASYCLVFTEGLFFLTKPSFFNSWSSFESMTVLFIAPLALNVLSLIVLVPGLIAVLLLPESLRMLPAIYTVLPAIILTFLILLLVENFTYTVWGFNIGSFKGIFRYVYTIAILACVIWLSRDLWRLVALLDQSPLGQKLKLSAAVLLLVSGLFSAINLTQKEDLFALELSKTEDDLPNILILSTDGLDASHMSAYGYHRETTPFIKSMLPQSLVVENHFTNNTKSTGSIGSLLSGKLPTKTRVIYPPDIFRGVDTYQHLPAILRKLGYRNADFSMRHYIDPYDLNMREGFDFANGRDIGEVPQSVTLPDVTRHAFIKES